MKYYITSSSRRAPYAFELNGRYGLKFKDDEGWHTWDGDINTKDWFGEYTSVSLKYVKLHGVEYNEKHAMHSDVKFK